MAKVDSSYDSRESFAWPDYYPYPEFWTLLQIYVYGGRPEMIDSVFNEYWPEYNPGKKDAHDRFKASLEINNVRRQLQDSDW
jgi:hypothetical protein